MVGARATTTTRTGYRGGVPRCCGAFTPSTRLVSISRCRGWFLFDSEAVRTASSDRDAPRRREKLRTDILFPRRGLDLSRFLPADAYAVYDLFGVINHLGSLSGGHYTSHVKVSPCSSDGVEEASIAFEESERWLHIDDDLVEPAKPEDVVTDGAYVLFYRRRRLSGRLVVGHTAVAPVV